MKEMILKLSTPKKLAAAGFLFGLIALFIGNPVNRNTIEVNAKEMALSTIKDQDRITPLILADWLIKENSDFTLVDLRNPKQFNEYNIPSSVNIPVETILNSDLLRNQKILLYGEDDVASAQAWFILKSSNYKSVYILKGGLTGWKNEILFPKLSANASPEESLAFEKLKQVSLHFGGSPQLISGENTASISVQTNPVPVLPKLSAPAVKAGGGAKKKKEGC